MSVRGVNNAIRILREGDESALERFVQAHAASSAFLIGNFEAGGLVDKGSPSQGTYAAAFDGDDIVAVAAHYWNDVVILQAPVDAVEVAMAAIRASGRPVSGIFGPRRQAEAVRRRLHVQAGDLRLDEAEKLYELQLADLRIPNLLSSESAGVRRPGFPELELLSAWRTDYEVAVLGQTHGQDLLKRARATVERHHAAERLWLLEHEGVLVACSGFNVTTSAAVQVGAVWTPRRYRNRGYARALVAGSLLHARQRGARKGTVLTGIHNVPAQRAYEALGFVEVGDYRMMRLTARRFIE